jgi:hypothetical protein
MLGWGLVASSLFKRSRILQHGMIDFASTL